MGFHCLSSVMITHLKEANPSCLACVCVCVCVIEDCGNLLNTWKSESKKNNTKQKHVCGLSNTVSMYVAMIKVSVVASHVYVFDGSCCGTSGHGSENFVIVLPVLKPEWIGCHCGRVWTITLGSSHPAINPLWGCMSVCFPVRTCVSAFACA